MAVSFYDTNCILNIFGRGNKPAPGFCISVKTLYELENIKTSSNKDGEVKYNARRAARYLADHQDEYEVVHSYFTQAEQISFGIDGTEPDAIICHDAWVKEKAIKEAGDSLVFYTDDVCCRNIARHVFGLNVCGLEPDDDDYVGYKVVEATDARLESFYTMLDSSNRHKNIFGLLKNEYLLILDVNGKPADIYYWTGAVYKMVSYLKFSTAEFGDVKPYKGDPYQAMALDCLHRNKVTMLCGPGGSGKSFLALAYLFKKLEAREIDKIVVFCNTVSTKNAARIGFLPGTRTEKLMESSIGNMLSSKLGDATEVERLIDNNQLVILPMCDVRGYDTTGMRAGVYITEAQNMDIELMKLALQRVGEDCFIIIDGDHDTQVDMSEFAGANNGMKRLSKVFRDHGFYGEVKLNTIYRSEIAALAQNM